MLKTSFNTDYSGDMASRIEKIIPSTIENLLSTSEEEIFIPHDFSRKMDNFVKLWEKFGKYGYDGLYVLFLTRKENEYKEKMLFIHLSSLEDEVISVSLEIY